MQGSARARVQRDFDRWYAAMRSTHGLVGTTVGVRESGGAKTPPSESFQRGLRKADAALASRVLQMSREEQAVEYKTNWMPAEARENRESAKRALNERYNAARQLGEVVARTRANAQRIKKGLGSEGADPHAEAVMEREIRLCKDSVAKLQALKQEIETSQAELAAGNAVLEREFESWLEGMQACAKEHTPRATRPVALDTISSVKVSSPRVLSPAERFKQGGHSGRP